MKKSIDEHADRFSDHAADYDESQDAEEYRECADLVVAHAAPAADDIVLDLGTGTGAIAFPLAEQAEAVVGRDISEGMLDEATAKAAELGVENVEFGSGRFREPNVDGPVDIVTSNFAMHHLDDEAKRAAIDVLADLEPHRIVLGDVMLFGDEESKVPFYDPSVDDPATVGVLADAFTDAGFALTAVEMVHEQVGVLVAERVPDAPADASE